MRFPESALHPKADIISHRIKCLLCAKSGHWASLLYEQKGRIVSAVSQLEVYVRRESAAFSVEKPFVLEPPAQVG